MIVKILGSESYITSHWSGGITKQLYIYPENSEFINKDFDFRISAARVDSETSSFTPFPGYLRKLLIVEGTLEINHKNQYQKTIKRMETDEFDGSWETTAVGKVNDFNIIYKAPYSCDLMPANSEKDVEFSLEILHNEILFIYVIEGVLELISGHGKIERDQLLMARSDFENQKIEIKSVSNAEWILVKIRH